MSVLLLRQACKGLLESRARTVVCIFAQFDAWAMRAEYVTVALCTHVNNCYEFTAQRRIEFHYML